MSDTERLPFDNSYSTQLKGFYAPWEPHGAYTPSMAIFNHTLAKELGLDILCHDQVYAARILSGHILPEGAAPLAQRYAGHQFGHFSPELGDGRAILLGELITPTDKRVDVHLKGVGQTAFSRGGDGRAGIGPVLREYLLSEAMHALGVPTTRALAAITTGEQIMRQQTSPGAVLARVADSHIRVGTFEYFAARSQVKQVRQLADYTLARHFPHLQDSDNPYLALIDVVSSSQAHLIASWMWVGFVHGVMNTDNTAISGQTLDYGPCAFLDHYKPDAVFSSIDRHGRYAYQQQPAIGLWNVASFAESLLPLLDSNQETAVGLGTEVVQRFEHHYQLYWLNMGRAKLGLITEQSEDKSLIEDLLVLLAQHQVDFTGAFRALADSLTQGAPLFFSFFSAPSAASSWYQRWCARADIESYNTKARQALMYQVNPVYIPRNHLVEAALTQVIEQDDYSEFETLLGLVRRPHVFRPGFDRYRQPAPASFGRYQTFCGT